jgi:hypothetical protein
MIWTALLIVVTYIAAATLLGFIIHLITGIYERKK